MTTRKTTAAPAKRKASGKRKAGAEAKGRQRPPREDGASAALKAALKEASGERPRRDPAGAAPSPTKLGAKERQEMRGFLIYLNDEAKAQISRLAIDQRRTAQDLGVEAINLLFRRYRLGEIA